MLTDYESTRKSIKTKEFIDMCTDCYSYIKDDVTTDNDDSNISIHDIIDIENNI